MTGAGLKTEPRRILLIHFGQMGDAVVALPSAGALRAAFPRAHITVLAPPAGGAIFKLAGFDEVWFTDRTRWRDRPWTALADLPALIAKLRHAKFDLSVDLHSYKETNLMAWLAGIPNRVAMLRPTRSWPALTLRRGRGSRQAAGQATSPGSGALATTA